MDSLCIPIKSDASARVAGRKCESMYFLTGWLSAARAGLADYTFPPIGCCPRRDARLSSPPCSAMGYGAGAPWSPIAFDLGYAGGKKRESIRLLTSWLSAPRAAITSYAVPPIGCSAVCGKHKLCEHVPADRLTFSSASGDNKLHCPANRV